MNFRSTLISANFVLYIFRWNSFSFNVHSVVLASACDYFQSVILEHGNSYTLKCVDSVTLVEVIRFCYLGEVRMSLDNVETIALAAHELKLESLKLKCSDFLESTLNSENYLQYALLADKCKLRASKEFAEKFFENNCTRICELKQINQWSTLQFDSFIEDLAKIKDGLFDELMKKVRSNENSALLTQLFSKDILQAIFRSFVSVYFFIHFFCCFDLSKYRFQFIAGYVESMVNCRDQSNMNIKLNGLSTPMVIPKSTPSVNHLSDKGLLILTKNHNANTIEFYAISDSDCTRFSLPKYRINANGMNLSTLKIFPHKDRIYICYLMRNQRLEIKTWKFKSQLIAEVSLPAAVQYIKPRLITACGDEILVSEEKFVTWPSEGYKTTICKFGLESANYTNIEFVYDSLKEIICFGEDIFIFSSQKSNVASFNLNTRMRTSRGTLNNNGIVRAVIYRGRLYVGVFIRSQCTLFVEQFNRRNNQWKVVSNL